MTPQDSTDKVLHFISRFTRGWLWEEVIECFSNGCCFWFAHILQERFYTKLPILMYCEKQNHFAAEIDGRVYDITGDVTDSYEWAPWHKWASEHRSQAQVIIAACRDFEDVV